METKLCAKCNQEKPMGEFYLKKNGCYHSYCNGCKSLVKKQWSDKNKVHIKEYKRNHRNRDAEYREKNREKLRLIAKKQNDLRKGKVREYYKIPENFIKRQKSAREWRQKNKEHSNLYYKKYYRKHPEKKLLHNMRTKLNKLLNGTIKSVHAKELLGCELDLFKKHMESQWTDSMNWNNHGFGQDKWHCDHIRPIESFYPFTEERLKECFHWSNYQPLWQSENISKNSNYNGILYRKSKNQES